jgi:copper resistance protein B
MTISISRQRLAVVAMVLSATTTPVLAQHAGHGQTPVQQTTEPAPDPHAGHVMPAPEPTSPAQEQGSQQAADHSMMEGMDHSTMGHDLPASAAPLDPIPTVTPADRAAAFPDVAGHAVHDKSIHYFVLVDRLETSDADGGTPVAWEASGWVGTDLNRLWVRSEGEAIDGRTEEASVELFYGRAIARWWDGVVGVRQDFGDGPSQTFAAIGVIGQAPYKFEVEATAYIGQEGQTGLAVEAEYDTLLTNRLILQWLAEAEAWGEDDPRRGIGSGLSTVEAGLRLRYEFTKQFAPYIGIARERSFGNTAGLRRVDGMDVDETRVVAGLRFWF